MTLLLIWLTQFTRNYLHIIFMVMNTNTVIFLGPQGSGKGTQVNNLTAALKEREVTSPLFHLQTGEAFRALKNSDTFTARRVTELIEGGQLVPDFMTTAVVVNELKDVLTPETVLICDGFPRNVTQAKFFDELLSFYERPDLAVIYLDTPEAVVRERMMGRGRSDDTEASINQRLALYKAQTEPLITYYQARPDTNLIRIDGSLPINAVFSAISNGLAL